MAYANISLMNVLAQCHYNPQLKQYMQQEFSHVLSVYPSMNARQAQINMSSAIYTILELSGTIPVTYQNNTYHIPVMLQYPLEYPNVSPLLVVKPLADMIIKPSEFVQQDGRTTLEIQKRWTPRCTTVQLLDEAKRAFSMKMPVFKKPKGSPASQPYPPGNQYLPQGFQQPGNYGLQNSNLIVGAVNNYIQNSQLGPQNGQIRPPTGEQLGNYPVLSGSQIPVAANNRPPSEVKPLNQGIDQKLIKDLYQKTLNELNEEIKVLTHESETLEKNAREINNVVRGFKEEIAKGESKKELLRASIKNTKEWIEVCSNGDCFNTSEEELIEFKNTAAKEYLILSSQDKALESSINGIVEALSKSILPAKDCLMLLKQMHTDHFMICRLKDKAESISKESP